jgi:hypothetical protein
MRRTVIFIDRLKSEVNSEMWSVLPEKLKYTKIGQKEYALTL